MILLCCKEIDQDKKKNAVMNKRLINRNRKPKLQLNGRIFMQDVLEVIPLQDSGKSEDSSRLEHTD